MCMYTHTIIIALFIVWYLYGDRSRQLNLAHDCCEACGETVRQQGAFIDEIRLEPDKSDKHKHYCRYHSSGL